VRPAPSAPWAEPFEVNSFHDFAVPEASLAGALEPLCLAPDGGVEAVRHESLPVVALMWHPEREPELDPRDRELLAALEGARP
jgi:putative glutamine amidotransferase